MREVTAFAPATVANVAVGFDILGFPVHAVGDRVTVRERTDSRIRIESIGGVQGASELSLDVDKNVAGYVIRRLYEDLHVAFGLDVTVEKGIPLSSGMGGSAASSVAALYAANALLDDPLSNEELLPYALLGEQLATGSAHGDNVAPALFGGITLLQFTSPLSVRNIPVPAGLSVALVHPDLRLDTRASRAVLSDRLPLKDMVLESSHLAGFILGCCTSDFALISESLEDVLIEPYRAPLVQRFFEVKKAALEAGALGCSLSGSGPSVFALCEDPAVADQASRAMAEVWESFGIRSESYSSQICTTGAFIEERV